VLGVRFFSKRHSSKGAMLLFFAIVVGLLSANFYTFLQDRKLQSVSLNALRMASWNLAQLGNEANMLDREIALLMRGVGDPEDLMLRYDILWSRYDYLLTSKESLPTRVHNDNEERLEALFKDLRALEPFVTKFVAGSEIDRPKLIEAWKQQKAKIESLVIDNFVGDETGRLMNSVEASRHRLANLRILTLIALFLVFLYIGAVILSIRNQSRTDPVTGLPNRTYLQSIHFVDPKMVIIICKIREFQMVLSEYGDAHAGDMTRLFVGRLLEQLQPDDQLIQVSQSEFVIIAQPTIYETVEDFVKRLSSSSHFDWRIKGSILHISGIFGVDAVLDEFERGWKERYQDAHRALAQALLEGKASYINCAEFRKRVEEQRAIHGGLISFLADEPSSLQLSIVYQPIVSAKSKQVITGAEVLLRCVDEKLGFVAPNTVVDVCEKFGLGEKLGRWLFRQIALETRKIYQDLNFDGYLSINLNPAMLSERLVSDVQTLLIGMGLPARVLCMEITEDNAALEFQRINPLIEELRDLGVMFALDDFGTGHSSLEYVRELKVDRLKIDRCFVDGIENDEDKARFLGSIIAMAGQVYMESVIEGVENEAQWRMVERLGGKLIQGYHAYKPMPFNDYMEVLFSSRANSFQFSAPSR
jgi:EAL domain-containing protein (putative c-di-GMP-specific phosphodiesterase class I)